MTVRHRVYLSPGLFGFGSLAAFVYFDHLERAFVREFEQRGLSVEIHVVDVQPTASIRRRAQRLADLVARTKGDDDGPIHLVGHSTGGLDARLLASPTFTVPDHNLDAWRGRIRSVSTLSTPHYGTPLASFFATVSGQRALYALSAFTIVALSLGSIPLSLISSLGGAFMRSTKLVGLELRILEQLTEGVIGLLGPSARGEVSSYLRAVKEDQGAVIQLTPEAMDLYGAGVADRPGVRYQSTVSMVPKSSALDFVRQITAPTVLASRTLFTAVHKLTGRYDARYPCAAPFAGAKTEELLVRAFGRSPGVRANDGVVPLRSQIWGEVVWAGYADHLDVLGHFDGRGVRTEDGELPHHDWMHSGAGFERARFCELVGALVDGMLVTPS